MIDDCFRFFKFNEGKEASKLAYAHLGLNRGLTI